MISVYLVSVSYPPCSNDSSIMKDYFLLALRLYFCVALVFYAEQGGLAKFNWGVQGISDNLVTNLGFPFDAFPLVFSYLVLAAELIAPLFMLVGLMSELGAFLLAGAMAVATYAHLVLWKQGVWSTIENKNNVHGCLVYLIFAVIIFVYGAGKFTLQNMFSSSEKSKSS